MALLARRRSAQPVSSRPEDISISKLTVPALPDDYDPRIRGSLIHDFSRPRARPNVGESKNHMADRAGRSRQPRELPDNPPRPPPQQQQQQQPQQQQQQQQQQNHRFSQPAPYRHINNNSVELPPKPHHASNAPEAEKQHERPYAIPPPISPPASNKSPPSTLRYKPPSVRDPSFTPLGLPRHLTSSASRFSFDLAGGASSSQEKLMEEKHKEKEAAKRAQGSELRSEFDADSDEFDYDAMMDDDGLEERIPGVNADLDGSDDGMATDLPSAMRYPMNTYVPTLPTVIPSPISPHGGDSLNQQSPVVTQQFPSGFLPPSAANGVPLFSQSNTPLEQPNIPPIYNGGDPIPAPLVSPELPMGVKQPVTEPKNDDDDMYYDDGLFGELPAEMQDSTFDESIFDDETSYLYDRKRRAAQPPQPLSEDITPQPQLANSNSQVAGTIAEEPINHGHPQPQPKPQETGKAMPAQTSENPQSQGLTEGNLEAYHSALAQAANDAARKGRFERNASLSETSLPEGESQTDPCLTADESRMSQTVETIGMEEPFDDFDYYDADGLDDDPIIAEANADVLENDDEGFYGQEFGFYAHSHENDKTERVYGGYFGVRGAEGVIRGRKIFREPSLTPITERSEWSTRNSIVSLATHVGHSSQISNPPLAQLVDMEGLDDEISLSALMKLRRGAWGGSNGSLRSSAASQGTASPSVTNPNHGSLNYYDTGSPIQMSGVFNSGSELNSPIPPDRECIPDARLRGDIASIRRHSDGVHSPPTWDAPNRNSLRSVEDDKSPVAMNNGAGDRISYVKSTDESGSEYWVLERRRTGDSGESELLERETMRHGRI
ncbi:hypothetical protein FQN49_008108 [Arthroderma sp. PD_2]|nr:hypothetical protein FQN49_008108 [Arthroderma sp. PD_2]